jgi:hypothetical protein
MTEGEAYTLQVFDLNGIGLPWMCMPCCSFIFIEDKTLCGFKAAKRPLHAAVGKQCFQLRPLMVYHSENPLPLKA